MKFQGELFPTLPKCYLCHGPSDLTPNAVIQVGGVWLCMRCHLKWGHKPGCTVCTFEED